MLRYLTGERLFRLEFGEAHVAIRAGSAPEQPDNVVQPFAKVRVGLFASQAYVDRHGSPASPDELANHRLIAHDDPDMRAPQFRWLRDHAPESSVVFKSSNLNALDEAIIAGAGIGFLQHWRAARCEGLVEVLDPMPEWATTLWLVTHVDLHRSHKVQTFLTYLKAASKSWAL